MQYTVFLLACALCAPFWASGMEEDHDEKRTEDQHFFDFSGDALFGQEWISDEIYAEIVKNTIIACVDVFLVRYNSNKDIYEYFIVLRANKPAEGLWFYPGGRQNPGENYFQAAMRHCKAEGGLIVIPLTALSHYQTLFHDSAWTDREGNSYPTHTSNEAIFAFLDPSKEADDIGSFRDACATKWIPINIPPRSAEGRRIFGDSELIRYLHTIYSEAIEAFTQNKAKIEEILNDAERKKQAKHNEADLSELALLLEEPIDPTDIHWQLITPTQTTETNPGNNSELERERVNHELRASIASSIAEHNLGLKP